MADKWTKISAFATIVLIGIPSAADFYPPLFEGLANQLPMEVIFDWMARLGTVAVGLLIGRIWAVKEIQYKSDSTSNEGDDEQPTVETIVGCVEVDEMAWRGIAEFSDVKVEDVDVELTPRCPDCQKEMTRESYELPTGRGGNPYKSPLRGQSTITRKKWLCPDDDCGYTADRESGQHSEAQRLFRGYVQDIVESEGQEYSLDNLIERVEGEVTPQSVWEVYAEVKQSSHVSTDCFR